MVYCEVDMVDAGEPEMDATLAEYAVTCSVISDTGMPFVRLEAKDQETLERFLFDVYDGCEPENIEIKQG